ncbi:unnamed protein product [Cunninghamella echinulata]
MLSLTKSLGRLSILSTSKISSVTTLNAIRQYATVENNNNNNNTNKRLRHEGLTKETLPQLNKVDSILIFLRIHLKH